jgi:hypothetical protein
MRDYRHQHLYGTSYNALNVKDPYASARAAGYRSGLEVAVANQLKLASVQFEYETLRIPFEQPQKKRHYTADVVLSNGIIVETKGRFVTADRQKHLLVQQQHPDLDIRFLFSNSRQRISKQSKTTYADWCQTKGFRFADKAIPSAWINESPNLRSLRAMQALKGK